MSENKLPFKIINYSLVLVGSGFSPNAYNGEVFFDLEKHTEIKALSPRFRAENFDETQSGKFNSYKLKIQPR